MDTDTVFSDADAAALYDLLNPWDPDHRPDDGFYFPYVMAAPSVLDVGCGTGQMLRLARARGHTGRLAGLDPDRAALARAARPADTGAGGAGPDAASVEWLPGTAAQAPRGADFDLATMTGHAFQNLLTDEDVRDSLAAIGAALRPGGRFVFETRHPQDRAWERWTRSHPGDESEVVDASGRRLRYWHDVDSIVGGVVTVRGTLAAADGRVLRVFTEPLRFLDAAALRDYLTGAGFTVEAQYGDWDRAPLGPDSREIITVARLP
jgi:SAM-dependent methyltransferase